MAEEVVLDAQAVIAFLKGEPGQDIVRGLLNEPQRKARPCLMCSVNWGEVLYTSMREYGVSAAELVKNALKDLPIRIISADQDLSERAAALKAIGGMSYPDCFAAALALQEKATLVTGDVDFKRVQDRIKIRWLPKA